MEKVIEFNTRRIFSLEEARGIVPVVYRITKMYSEKVQALINRLDMIQSKDDESVNNLENQINDLVQEWQTKMEKLGAQTKGLWIADFDSGEGFYCWKFPEKTIRYWHRYNDGFSGRKEIDSDSELPLEIS